MTHDHEKKLDKLLTLITENPGLSCPAILRKIREYDYEKRPVTGVNEATISWMIDLLELRGDVYRIGYGCYPTITRES